MRRRQLITAGVVLAMTAGAVVWLLWPGGPILDTSAQIDDPGVRRALGIAPWSSGWAVVNTGNELQWLRLSDYRLATSTVFRVPPFGDRDYNLFNFAVCEGCEFGLAGFQSCGAVVFRVVPSGPSWGEHQRYPAAKVLGGATWRSGADQYLLAASLLELGRVDLLRVTGVTAAGLELLQSVETSGVDGGVYLPGDPGYLWTVSGTHVYRWRVTGNGAAARLEPLGELTRAGWVRGPGVALDASAGLLAAASPYGLELWSIDQPESPILLSRWQPHPTLDADTVALRWPYLWAGAYGGQGAMFTHTYDVTDPAHPLEVGAETWADGAPAQQYQRAGNMGALWLPDYRLLVARWSVLLLLEPEWQAPPEAIFADGFEAGSAASWSDFWP